MSYAIRIAVNDLIQVCRSCLTFDFDDWLGVMVLEDKIMDHFNPNGLY